MYTDLYILYIVLLLCVQIDLLAFRPEPSPPPWPDSQVEILLQIANECNLMCQFFNLVPWNFNWPIQPSKSNNFDYRLKTKARVKVRSRCRSGSRCHSKLRSKFKDGLVNLPCHAVYALNVSFGGFSPWCRWKVTICDRFSSFLNWMQLLNRSLEALSMLVVCKNIYCKTSQYWQELRSSI